VSSVAIELPPFPSYDEEPAPQPYQAPQAYLAPGVPPYADELEIPAAVKRLFDLVDACGRDGISDVHVHPNKPLRRLYRGNLRKAEGPSGIFTQDEIHQWLHFGKPDESDPLGAKGHCSVGMDSGTYRIRCTFRKSTAGTTVTFRLIPSVVPNADAIGVPKIVQALTTRTSGLIVVEGPTGSGKTTLIASLINKINHEDNKHIYIVEDPNEFIHIEDGHTSIVQREIGVHALNYATAIEDAMRSKPNVIVIGELLDPETTKAALHAATTGHLVITTAHAGSVTEALDSFIGKFTADEQPQIRSRLSQSLLAILVQKLVPTKDGKLTAARELLINDLNFSELIRDEKAHMIRGQIASGQGCFTMEDSLADLAAKGAITPEAAMANAKDHTDMQNHLARRGLMAGGLLV
jgi:twitching motility protein PilT